MAKRARVAAGGAPVPLNQKCTRCSSTCIYCSTPFYIVDRHLPCKDCDACEDKSWLALPGNQMKEAMKAACKDGTWRTKFCPELMRRMCPCKRSCANCAPCRKTMYMGNSFNQPMILSVMEEVLSGDRLVMVGEKLRRLDLDGKAVKVSADKVDDLLRLLEESGYALKTPNGPSVCEEVEGLLA